MLNCEWRGRWVWMYNFAVTGTSEKDQGSFSVKVSRVSMRSVDSAVATS